MKRDQVPMDGASWPAADAGWTMILEPRRPWLDPHLGELWHARDLIQPLLTALTFKDNAGIGCRMTGEAS